MVDSKRLVTGMEVGLGRLERVEFGMSGMKDSPFNGHDYVSAAGVQPEVEVLLATRNNADYIRQLLESLLAQTEQNFWLVVSDDCSSDDTVAIMQSMFSRFRHPVRLIRRDRPSGSAAANFGGLLQESRADFVFLCDADDVWHPGKLALFLNRARLTQAQRGPQEPLFLFSDADIIDSDGQRTNESYWAFKNTVPERCLNLSRLLVCTPMIGCATLMNRALVELARDVPVEQVTGHDWWALLVAACFGTVDFLPEKTISYRIHGKNSSNPVPISMVHAGKMGRMAHEVRRRIAIRLRQARPLLQQFGDRMPAASRQTVEQFLAIEHQSFVRRRVTMFSHGYNYPDRLRNLALFLFG